ncbi:hypothetical protein TNCV_1704171 [Trichonephila clavipes]|nr:hypothetical protein TNCV_1704171 [Trichonephila clavipes]
MDNGIMRLNHDSYSMILKEVRNLTEEIEALKDIDDIKQDLSEQGFLVSKVAQLTKNKSKFKLPIFMVELQKSPDSPDIFKLEKCCYLTVKIDTFNRRPGPTQYQSKVKNDISFANALKGNQQMAPLPENPAPLNEPETAPAPKEEKKSKCEFEDDDNGTFGFMDAIIELKKVLR